MRNQATGFDINVTVSPGMVLAPPPPYALRIGLRQTSGTICIAGSMIGFSFFLAGQPWNPQPGAIATLPYLLAGVLFFVASDLLMLKRSHSRRLRQSAIMNGLLLGVGLTLFVSVVLGERLAWPTVFPLLFAVFSVPIAGPLNIGFFSRLRLDDSTWRRAIATCVLMAMALMVAGFVPFQNHIAGQW